MKKVLGLTLLAALGAFVVFMTGCIPPSEVPTPTGLTVEATADGAGVKLTWNAVTVEGEDVTYDIYFEGALLEFGEAIEVTYYEDADPGKAGEYEVIAVAGGEESEPAEISTKPIAVAPLEGWDINASGESGITFNVAGKAIVTHSMGATGTKRDEVDFYFTNWAGLSAGFEGPYYLASAHKVNDDPGDPDPGYTDWRTTGISDELGGNIESTTIVPTTSDPDNKYYYDITEELVINGVYAISTQDDYFGIVQVTNIDETDGGVEFKATFQPIKGLRLF
ncbi:MAG: hypothetical protein U9Q76_01355 [candidate division WOR-3 bacterium]|nr:hypothetical protein [candidate division WOR-3 bacterium]